MIEYPVFKVKTKSLNNLILQRFMNSQQEIQRKISRRCGKDFENSRRKENN